MAIQAIQEYIEREYAVMAEIKAGEKDIDEGRTVTLERAEPWLRQLTTGRYSEPLNPASRMTVYISDRALRRRGLRYRVRREQVLIVNVLHGAKRKWPQSAVVV